MLAAVLGSPIAHSLSPTLHRAAYAALDLPDWEYRAIELADLSGLRRLIAAGPWAGWSLTMPLKTLIQPLLPELSAVAEATGSVNTVLFSQGADNHPRCGDNTDVLGLVRSLTELGVTAGPALVLGSGATACSAVAALIELGVSRPRVLLRSQNRAAGVRACAARLGAEVQVLPWEHGRRALAETAVAISTVPIGAAAAVIELLPDCPPPLLDVLYDPWPTPIVQACWDRSGVAMGGLSMLVHQAAAQVQLMTGLTVSQNVVRAMCAAGDLKLGRSVADAAGEMP